MPNNIIARPALTSFKKNQYADLTMIATYDNNCVGCGPYMREFKRLRAAHPDIRFVENPPNLPLPTPSIFRYVGGIGTQYMGPPNGLEPWMMAARRYEKKYY